MKRHLNYLKYLLLHKWYVLKVSRMIGGVSLWRGLMHDISKFLPVEWFAYASCFYKVDGGKQYHQTPEFLNAWNHHQKKNRHHWNYWVVIGDSGEIQALPMPEKYVREMVCDWIGAGLAINGKVDVWDWYAKSKDKMIHHPDTRRKVEMLLCGLRYCIDKGIIKL